MRLRLLKLSCLVLVLALAGGLIVFNFAGEDLRSALIQTSSVTPATDIHLSSGLGSDVSSPGVASGDRGAPQKTTGTRSVGEAAAPSKTALGSTAQPGSGSGENTAFATIAPAPTQTQPGQSDTLAINPPAAAPSESASATASQPPAPDVASGKVASAPVPPLSAQPKTSDATPSPATADTGESANGVSASAAGAAAGTETASNAPTPSGATGTSPAVAAAPASSAPNASNLTSADRSETEDATPTEGVTSKVAGGDSFPAAIAAENGSKPAVAANPVAKPAHEEAAAGAPAVVAESTESPHAAAPRAKPARVARRHRAARQKEAALPPPAPTKMQEVVASSPAAQPTPLAEARAAQAAPSVPSTPTPLRRQLLAQVAPPASATPARRPLAPAASAPPSRDSDWVAHIAVGPQMLIEFPRLESKSSGALAGSGSVTNSSARVIPGIVGSWTSAPVSELPLNPRFGGSLFIGAPASGDSVVTATTSGGYTLKLGEKNNWPVIMPRFFMGVPVTDGTQASLGTGIWVNNVKETATLANGSGTQSDVHSGVMMRPFLSAAIEQRAPLFGFLPTDAQELKLSGGYIFGDTNFQAGFCASGQTCVRTSDQGSWFLGLSFEMGFPASGTATR